MKRKLMPGFAVGAATAAMMLSSAPLQASQNDDRIESSFKKSFVYTTYLNDDAIQIESSSGVVTLKGSVSEESHKDLAQDTAAGLPGVTSVDNRLLTKAEVATLTADEKLRRKVALVLTFHRKVDAEAAHVAVSRGVVTLSGEASSLAQKELTGEYARDVDGVTGLKNNMKVATTHLPVDRTAAQTIDDASITAQVRAALLIHRSTSMLKTMVDTRSGKVTVSGPAKNAAEKALVSKLVNDIRGVTSMENNMTVQVARRD
ncbi:MAG: BON domain-containing protein [Pseudomonadota bacterium]